MLRLSNKLQHNNGVMHYCLKMSLWGKCTLLLALAEIKFIFFIAACMALYSPFVTKTALITQQYSVYC